jgi:hypothetical protein
VALPSPSMLSPLLAGVGHRQRYRDRDGAIGGEGQQKGHEGEVRE